MAVTSLRTTEMVALVERMRTTQSVALVRVGSQWWAAENDLPVGQVAPAKALELAATASRRDRDRLMFYKPVFWTGTVNALVRRRELRFVGRKLRATTPPRAPTHARAEFRRS